MDCDIDATDLHWLLNPRIEGRQDFPGGRDAFVVEDRAQGAVGDRKSAASARCRPFPVRADTIGGRSDFLSGLPPLCMNLTGGGNPLRSGYQRTMVHNPGPVEKFGLYAGLIPMAH